jgi:hypothetical protein
VAAQCLLEVGAAGMSRVSISPRIAKGPTWELKS